MCILDFSAELEFWQIRDINLEICCVEKFFARSVHCTVLLILYFILEKCCSLGRRVHWRRWRRRPSTRPRPRWVHHRESRLSPFK